MKEFERRKQIPQYWCNKSSDLRASAGALWFCIRHDKDNAIVEELGLGPGFSMEVALSPVFPMLCGLSLELMYKAICVAKKVDFNKEHNLQNLCKLAKVPVTDEDFEFLALFTESVVWDAKYPVPLEKKRNSMELLSALHGRLLYDDISKNKTGHIKRYNGRLSWDTFNKLWVKACEVYSVTVER